MARRRHRRIAVIAFVVVVTAAIAQSDPNFLVRPMNGSSIGTPQNVPSNIVVSVRNNTASTRTLTIVAQPSFPGCATVSIRRIDDGTPNNGATLDPNRQQQFVIMTNGIGSNGPHPCRWLITSSPIAETFDTTFNIGAGQAIDPQPNSIAIGSGMLSSEFQSIVITNNTTAPETVTATIQPTIGGSALQFAGGAGCNTSTCEITVPPIVPTLPNYIQVPIRCAGGGITETGTIRYFKGGGPIAQHSYSCASQPASPTDPTINIVEDSLAIRGPATIAATGTVMVNGMNTQFVSAAITGADASYFSFASSYCAPASQTCMPAAPLSLPRNLDVSCTPTSTRRDATLTVSGMMGAQDAVPVSCALSTPSLQVAPPIIDVGDVGVGTMKSGTVVLENSGSTLMTGVVIDTGDPAWTTVVCTNTMPCTIEENTMLPVAVTFRPTEYGPNNPVMMVASSNGGMGTAQLRGNGQGSRLRVLTPTPPQFLVDLGTLSLDELRAKQVKLYADGNVGLDVGIGAVTDPFSTTATSVPLAAMAEGMFDVRCQSTTALPQTDRTLALDPGPESYMNDTMELQIRCKVSSTRVRVMPNELDFGEVQKGTATKSIAVKITNPGMPATLQFVRIDNPRAELTLLAPTTPHVLGTNEEVTATLSLTTANELVLEDIALEVGVDDADPLVTPIAGKVVVASARVSPSRLDLGTVCVGTPVDGQVTMTNDGTATLRVQPPSMMEPFAPLFIDPILYPSDNTGVPLFAGEQAIAGVMTANTEKGKVSSTLRWDVNVATAPFSIPVNVEFISEGAGVSPERIEFDPIEANVTSPQRIITLENCEARTVVVDVIGIVASKGSADAWMITPSSGLQDLEPRKTTRIVARFAPKKPGHYEAKIHIQIDGRDYFVDLIGDALGDVTERKSLYGCDCNTGGSPWSLLGLLGLVLLVFGQRRSSVSNSRNARGVSGRTA